MWKVFHAPLVDEVRDKDVCLFNYPSLKNLSQKVDSTN